MFTKTSSMRNIRHIYSDDNQLFLFSLLPQTIIWIRLAYRIALIPVIGALSYEIMRFSGKKRSSQVVNILMYPGG
jgi:uncharacterized protein YqhQ